MAKRIISALNTGLWVGMVVLLPITSMPLIVRLTGSDVVAAPSGLFLAGLVVLWLIPFLLKRGPFPIQSLPLLLFAAVAIFSTAGGWLSAIPPRKTADMLRTPAVALITLAVGLCFYLVSASWPNTDKRLRLTLRVLNYSGMVVLLWALTQAAVWYLFHRYPTWMRTIHSFYSVGTLFRQRFVGFALEPSWLANQLNMLYLPYWFAATLRSFTAHRGRFKGLSIENVLFAGGIVVLLLTLSRVGLLAFLMVVGFLILRSAYRFSSRINRGRASKNGTTSMAFLNQKLMTGVVFLGILLAFALAILVLGVVLSHLDYRMAKLFTLDFTNQEDPILYLAQELSLASRISYWRSGWRLFGDHPWMGVGLGNAGFYMPEYLDGYAWRLPEVRDLVFRSGSLLNIKSLWIRILAETGIVGFAFYLAWWFMNWWTGVFMESRNDRLQATLGSMVLFSLVASLLEGFSLDTFALPYPWIPTGLLGAAFAMACKNEIKSGSTTGGEKSP